MNLNAFNLGMPFKWLPPKILLIMKLIIVLMISFLMQVSAAGYGQKINIDKNNTSLKEVLENIKMQTGYVFFSKDYDLKQAKISVKLKDADIDEALEACLKGLPLSYKIVDKTVFVQLKEKTFLERVVATLNSIDASGRVVDSENRPLPGASVKVKKTGKGVSTDKDGRFFLRGVEEGAVLIVSFIGYLPKEVSASANMGNVVLEQSLSKLDEIQVIAYGTTTQRLSTGNVTTIKADVIEKQPVNNPLLALQGRVPGLFIEQATGFAGTGVKVRIQGQNSVFNGNDPLYVIDGTPYISQLLPYANVGDNSVQGNSGLSTPTSNPLNYLNPADIESIDILKDADATAIYGSRAANGAILITTKKGRVGDTKVNLSMQVGWGKVPKKLEVLNTQQYLEMRREAMKNDNIQSPSTYDFDLNGGWDTTRDVNWQKELIGGKALYSDLQSSISGGSALSTFLIGAGYHKETSVIPGDFSDVKASVHFNINTSSSNQKFKVQFSGSYMDDNNKLPTEDLTSKSLKLAPLAPEPFNADGTINWAPTSLGVTSYSSNPLAFSKNSTRNKTAAITGNSLISYQVFKGLDIKSSFGYTSIKSNIVTLLPLSAVKPEDKVYSQPASSFTDNNIRSWLIEPQVTYNQKISKGKLEILAGTTFQENQYDGRNIFGSGYITDLLIEDLKSASNTQVRETINSIYKYSAAFGRISYNWTDKYLVNLSARRDGSSRFGPKNQFNNFGAIGTAWIFSNESFLKNNLTLLSFGKLRLSYGTTGSDQIGEYKFLDLYTSVPASIPYQGAIGLTTNTLNNPYLQWEETKKFQVGLDLGFLRDKILFNANYNRNRSSNQLMVLPLPIITGAINVPFNLPALVQNTGWEFTLNVSQQINNFEWRGGINLTIPNNKLISFTGELNPYSDLVIGQPLTVQHLFNFAGVSPTSGLYQFYDSNGSLTSTPSNTDLTAIANTDPKFYGGFQNDFTYKSFTIGLLLQFVKQIGYDQSLLGFGYGAGGFQNNGLSNQNIAALDRWKENGDIVSHQYFSTRFTTAFPYLNAVRSNAVYKDASYIRIKNVSISWSVPVEIKRKLGINNLGLFIHGQNLYTITGYKGLDPETKGFGLPPLRTITFGAKLTL